MSQLAVVRSSIADKRPYLFAFFSLYSLLVFRISRRANNKVNIDLGSIGRHPSSCVFSCPATRTPRLDS